MNRLIAVLISAALATVVFAQNINPVTVRVSSTPVSKALYSLFDQMGVRYQILSGVKGNVTVDATRADSTEVMFDILNQVDAISEFRNGVYVIRPMRRSRPVQSGQFNANDIVSVVYENADIRLAAKELLGQSVFRYNASNDVRGVVFAAMRNVRMGEALKVLLSQVDSTYAVAGGKIQIMRRSVETPGG